MATKLLSWEDCCQGGFYPKYVLISHLVQKTLTSLSSYVKNNSKFKLCPSDRDLHCDSHCKTHLHHYLDIKQKNTFIYKITKKIIKRYVVWFNIHTQIVWTYIIQIFRGTIWYVYLNPKKPRHQNRCGGNNIPKLGKLLTVHCLS